MKKLLVAIAAVLVSASAFAQGTVAFNNRPPSGDARVSRPDGTGAGAGVTAALYATATGTYLTPTTTFRSTSAAAAYFVTAVDVAVPGVPGGGSVALRMRAWDTAAGSYAAAVSGGLLSGESPEITVTGLGNPTGQPPTPAAALTGLQGFTLVVPEPSTIALGVLGAAALLLRRRK